MQNCIRSLVALTCVSVSTLSFSQDLFDSGAASTGEGISPSSTALSPEVTLLELPMEGEYWRGIAAIKSDWLLLDEKGKIYRGSGASWEKDVVAPDEEIVAFEDKEPEKRPVPFTKLVSNGEVVVIAGIKSGDHRISYDGRTWTKQGYSKISPSEDGLRAWPNGEFTSASQAMFSKHVSYSSDLKDWTEFSKAFPKGIASYSEAVCFRLNGRTYLADERGAIFGSRRGRDWDQEVPLMSQSGKTLPFVGYGNNTILVAYTDMATFQGALWRKTYSGSWNKVTIPGSGLSITELVYARGRFVATVMHPTKGTGTSLWTSTDGSNWEKVVDLPKIDDVAWYRGQVREASTVGFGSVPATSFQQIAYGPNGFLITGPKGRAIVYKTPELPDTSSTVTGLIELGEPKLVMGANSYFNIHSNKGVERISGSYYFWNDRKLYKQSGDAWEEIPLPGDLGSINSVTELDGVIYVGRADGYNRLKSGSSEWEALAEESTFYLVPDGDRLISWGGVQVLESKDGDAWEHLRWHDLVSAHCEEDGYHTLVPVQDRVFALSGNGGLYESSNYKGWDRLLSKNKRSRKLNDYQDIVVGNGTAMFYSGFFDPNASEVLAKVGGRIHWLSSDGRWNQNRLPFDHSIILDAGYVNGKFVAVVRQQDRSEFYDVIYETEDGSDWDRVGWLDGLVSRVGFGDTDICIVGERGEALVFDIEKGRGSDALAKFSPITEKGYYPAPVRLKENLGYDKNEEAEKTLRYAKNNSAWAAYQMGEWLVSYGNDSPFFRNPEQAEHFYRVAYANGEKRALENLTEVLIYWVPSRGGEALSELKPKADTDAVAAYMMAKLYHTGFGVEKSEAETLAWLNKAVELGNENAKMDALYIENLSGAEEGTNGEALYYVALALENENSKLLNTNPSAAFEKYWKAANLGYGIAMRRIVEIAVADKIPYLKKETLDALEPKKTGDHLATARLWIDKGVELKDPVLTRYKAQVVSSGQIGYTKNHNQAFTLISQAAELGDLDAKYLMGEAYEKGVGVPKDIELAKTWYKKAQDAGHQNAGKKVAALEAMELRSSQRAAVDQKVEGVSPSVMAWLKQTEANAAAEVIEADLRQLFVAIWHDADYDLVEEDLIQELGALASGSSISITDTNGESIEFPKPIAAANAQGFRNVFPIPFPADNPQFAIQSWSIAQTGGVMTFYVRKAKKQENFQLAAQFRNMLAQTAMQAAQKDGQYASTPQNFINQINDFVARANALDTEAKKDFKELAYEACYMVVQRAKNKNWEAHLAPLKN